MKTSELNSNTSVRTTMKSERWNQGLSPAGKLLQPSDSGPSGSADNDKELWDSRTHQTGKETGGEGMLKGFAAALAVLVIGASQSRQHARVNVIRHFRCLVAGGTNLLNQLLNWTVHCGGREFRVLNCYDQKSLLVYDIRIP
ncbi:hypothetical protein Tco_1506075 [Tanacetum coccineum]